jgi:hypothetical protein
MTNEEVVNTGPTTQQAEEATNTEPTIQPEEPFQDPTNVDQTKAGDKTEPNQLLASLQDERDKRRDGEAKVKELEEEIDKLKTSSDDEAWSDEGKALQKEIKDVNSQLVEIKKENAKKDLLIANPILKEHLAEFEEFQANPDNKGMNMRTAAKAFLVEKDLIGQPARKGLEKPTGGDKQPVTSGKMTAEDAKNLRLNDWEGYVDKLNKGLIEIAD